MRCATLRPLALLVLGLGPAVAVRAADEPSSVRDQAGLFSPQTVRQADERIADIRRAFHRRVLVDARREIPNAARFERKELGGLFSRQETEFHKLAVDMARGVPDFEGVYILFYRKDAHANLWVAVVEAPTDRDDEAFPPESRRKVLQAIRHAEARGPDAALLAGLDRLNTE